MTEPDPIRFARHGVILNTMHYDRCVAFYRDVLALPIMFAKGEKGDGLTCFALGDAYLMVEHGGVAVTAGKSVDLGAIKLRFNVHDVGAAAQRLQEAGVDVELFQYDWGTTAEFYDPDGNRCALRSEHDFLL